MNILYSRILFKKNKNSFKKNIDTSISVDRKKTKKYHKKLITTPIKKLENPFLPLKTKKILYFPYNLLNSSREKAIIKLGIKILNLEILRLQCLILF